MVTAQKIEGREWSYIGAKFLHTIVIKFIVTRTRLLQVKMLIVTSWATTKKIDIFFKSKRNDKGNKIVQ